MCIYDAIYLALLLAFSHECVRHLSPTYRGRTYIKIHAETFNAQLSNSHQVHESICTYEIINMHRFIDSSRFVSCVRVRLTPEILYPTLSGYGPVDTFFVIYYLTRMDGYVKLSDIYIYIYANCSRFCKHPCSVHSSLLAAGTFACHAETT